MKRHTNENVFAFSRVVETCSFVKRDSCIAVLCLELCDANLELSTKGFLFFLHAAALRQILMA